MAKIKTKKISVSVPEKLTENQLMLLKKFKDADGYEFDDLKFDDYEEDLDFLCEHELAFAIEGEQWYVTKLGLEYLKNEK